MTLDPQRPWRPSARDRHLTVNSGALWLTQTNRPTDLIVEAGATIELRGRGWIIEALGGTPCDFTTSTSSPTRPTPATPSRSFSRKAG